MPEFQNPFAPLYNFVSVFLDDIIVFTPKLESEASSLDFHKRILGRVFHKLEYHDLRINAEKTKLFRKEVEVLGHIVKDGQVRPNPKRLEDLLKSPFPKSRNQMLAFLSLAGQIRHCLSLHSHSLLARLYDLTSVKRAYEPTDEHHKAFEAVKREMSSEQLVSWIPSGKPTLLYCDASQSLLGACLFEIDFGGAPIITEEEVQLQGRSLSIYQSLGRKVYRYCKEKEILLSETDIVSNGSCFYHSVLDQLRIYGLGENFPTDPEDFRIIIGNYALENRKLRQVTEPFREAIDNRPWQSYVRDYMREKEPVDECGVMTQATADFLGRDIVLITDNINQKDPIVIKSSTSSFPLPPLFLGFFPPTKINSVGHYVSLVVQKPTALTGSSFTHLSREKQWKELSREQLFDQVRTLWQKRDTKKKPMLRLLGCMSKSIPEVERKNSIWVLELKALLQALHNFRDIILASPTCITLVDSRSLYLLLHRTIGETALKLNRWHAVIQQKFPQLLFYLIGTTFNAADFFSRQFKAPGFNPEKLALKPRFESSVHEMEGELLSIGQAEAIANENDQYVPRCLKKKEAALHTLSASTDRLSEIALPLKELAARLSPDKIAAAQRKELAESYQEALATSTSNQKGPHKVHLQNGLLFVTLRSGDDPLIYVPPSVVGLLIAYHHLLSAHKLGRDGLYEEMKRTYYFPAMRATVLEFIALCQNCAINNGIMGRKSELGKTLKASAPLQILYMDITTLKSRATSGGSDYLVLVDSFSKYLCVYPCPRKVNDRVIIKHLKTYFAHMGLCHTIVSDNAAYFRSRVILAFLSSLGIKMVHTAHFRSQSKGQVERFNRVLKKALRASLMTKSSYDFEDYLFLVQLQLNNSINLSTKFAPSEVVLGRRTLNSPGLALSLKEAVLSGSLIDSSLARDVQTLRQRLEDIWRLTERGIEKTREKEEKRFNRSARNASFAVGDLVFVLDHRISPSGSSKILDPPLQKSPFMVLRVFSKVLDVVRLVDRWTTRIHMNDAKKIKDFPSDSPLLAWLPKSVKQELGGPVTWQQIRDLARTDNLPVLFREQLFRQNLAHHSGVQTRAERKRLAALQGEIDHDFQQAVEDDDDDDDDVDEADDAAQRRVRFADGAA